MRLTRVLLALTIFSFSRTTLVQAYEWKAHNGLSNAARRLAIKAASDTRLEAFLSQNQGISAEGKILYELDTRADRFQAQRS